MRTVIYLTGLILSGIIFSCNSNTDNAVKNNHEVLENSGKNEIIADAGNITVRGSSGYEFETELEGAYIITFKEKKPGNLENVQFYIEIMGGWTEWMPGGIIALRSNGWYEGATIQSYSQKATHKFKVTASGAFEITFEKLPLLKAVVHPPQEFSGAGSTFFGPVALSGTKTFRITCDDACQVAFTVNILDADTGNILLNPDNTILYTNVGAGYKLTNSIHREVTKSGLSGNYLIWVSTNGNAKYSVGIN